MSHLPFRLAGEFCVCMGKVLSNNFLIDLETVKITVTVSLKIKGNPRIYTDYKYISFDYFRANTLGILCFARIGPLNKSILFENSAVSKQLISISVEIEILTDDMANFPT